MNITILGKQYEVKFIDSDSMVGQAGGANSMSQVICINKEQGHQQQADTLVHEVIHVISYDLGLDLDEATVRRLACGLISCSALKVDISLDRTTYPVFWSPNQSVGVQ